MCHGAPDGLLQIPGSFLMLALEEEDLASMVERQGIMILGSAPRMCFSSVSRHAESHPQNHQNQFNLEIQ